MSILKNNGTNKNTSIDDYLVGLNEGQKYALKEMANGTSIALLGVGGTGKTYVLNKYIEYAKANDINLVVTAPTGIAAVNCKGTTIHSQFALGGVVNPRWNYFQYMKKLPSYKREVIKHTDVLIIDEISMTRYDYFRRIMQIVDGELFNNHHRIQVIVSGDFGQLPPILPGATNVAASKTATIKNQYSSQLEVFKKYYPTINKEAWSFLDTEHWSKLKVIELTEVVRQTDKNFIDALNKIRLGDTTGVSYINKYSSKKLSDEAIVICCTNREVDAINQAILDQLPGEESVSHLKYIGDTEGVKLNQDDVLRLKIGCKVMTTVNAPINLKYNDKGQVIGQLERDYINGSFGEVIDIEHESEDSNEISSVTVRFDNGNEFEIELYEWKINVYVYNPKTDSFGEKEIGSITGLPLRLRSAITVHKSQGMTFDNIVINTPKFWA